MESQPQQKKEQPSTYFVQDRANEEELTRLSIQDRMTTQAMGGVLPEQHRFSPQRVLDIGCGPGGWLIALAIERPEIRELIGVDISERMIAYARSQADREQVSDRVTFQVGDALGIGASSDERSFDLVTMRFAMGWLRSWNWSKVVQEYKRLVRPGGIIRFTEVDVVAASSSPGLVELNQLTLQALSQAGHLFAETTDGITSYLAPLLRQHGLLNVQERRLTCSYQAGTELAQLFIADVERFLTTAKPFLLKWIHIPGDYDQLCQNAVNEMHLPHFWAKTSLLTAWGVKP